MRRFHVHIAVEDLEQSTTFYSHLFGKPSVLRDDYAKWMIEDPPVNFAISSRGHATGVNHLGIQVDHDADLRTFHERLSAADPDLVAEAEADCCYARSDKYWVTDPSGIAWETFHTLADIPTFGKSHWDQDKPLEPSKGSTCCAPSTASQSLLEPAIGRAPASCCAPPKNTVV